MAPQSTPAERNCRHCCRFEGARGVRLHLYVRTPIITVDKESDVSRNTGGIHDMMREYPR